MILNAREIIDLTDLESLVSSFGIELKRSGSTMKGLCPFHDEKSPSFSVNTKDNRYKCFGCGNSGDAVTFLMEHKGMQFFEAVEFLANFNNIQVERGESAKPEKEQRGIVQALEAVLTQYQLATPIKQNKKFAIPGSGKKREYDYDVALRYELTRASNLKLDSQQKKLLTEVGFLNEKGNSRLYKRVIFPLRDHVGRLIGFAGRATEEKQVPKYLNPQKSDIYDKDKFLYGLYHAKPEIRRRKVVFLVEGYTDVIALAQAGIYNAIASCGTALTENQAKLIRKYCDRVIICTDGDEAGKKAALSQVFTLVKAGIKGVDIVHLDDGEDPDSFVSKHNKKGFLFCVEKNSTDGILAWIESDVDMTSPWGIRDAIARSVEILANLGNEVISQYYIKELTDRDKPLYGYKKELEKAIYKRISEIQDDPLTPEQKEDIMKYGIYEDKNRYFLSDNPGQPGYPISNFVVKPVMLIIGRERSHRLIEAVNVYERSFMTLIDSNDMTELGSFKKSVERMGNYVFKAGATEFVKVKEKVYDKMRNCVALNTMGHNSKGFWTWGNGITTYKGEFIPIDEMGRVTFDGTDYFLPAFSKVNHQLDFDDATDDYTDEKRFVYCDNTAQNVPNWLDLFLKVHGDNGKLALAYYCAALFRDLIYARFRFFPHLNLFGPSGSGKSYLALSLMAMFGQSLHAVHIVHSTEVAAYRKLSKFKNALVWFDEYANNIHPNRVELLKSAYDGVAREKGVASNDNRTQKTSINSAVILSGQQQPTQDIALFKRCITLSFDSGSNDAAAQSLGDQLKAIEKSGLLSQVTHRIIQFREKFDTQFNDIYESSKALIRLYMDPEDQKIVQDRILNNYTIIAAAISIVSDLINWNLDKHEVIRLISKRVVQQSGEIAKEDEVSLFWNIFDYLVSTGTLVGDMDYDIRITKRLTVKNKEGQIDQLEFMPEKLIVYLSFTKAHPEYLGYYRSKFGRNGLSLSELKYYLKASDGYIGEVNSRRFGDTMRRAFAFEKDLLPIETSFAAVPGVEAEF